MCRAINIPTLLYYIENNYNLDSINNVDFIVDIHLRLKKELHIKSVIKQGFLANKAIIYLQIKNETDIFYLYYIDKLKQINIDNKYNSKITQKE